MKGSYIHENHKFEMPEYLLKAEATAHPEKSEELIKCEYFCNNLVLYYERTFHDLVDQYGLKTVSDCMDDIMKKRKDTLNYYE